MSTLKDCTTVWDEGVLNNFYNKKKCPHCGKAIGADWNFCEKCGGKVKDTCDCWVLNKTYDCGQAKCPGYKLKIQLYEQSKKNFSKNQSEAGAGLSGKEYISNVQSQRHRDGQMGLWR